MLRPRIFPTLLLKGQGLVKGVNFKNYRYIGDPINAVKIFNDKEVDELLFLDITASGEKRTPSLELIEKIADECFMPFSVGGGIRTVEDMRALLSAGAEKISINTAAVEDPSLIRRAADMFGSQSIIVSIDVKSSWLGKINVWTHSGKKKTKLNPLEWALEVEKLGAGEIFLNSIDNDGKMEGYDLKLVKMISDAVNIPVIACGGAGKVDDLYKAIHEAGASAAAAGSMFVFHGARRGVLINFPSAEELKTVHGDQ
jgi:cyclase